MPFLSHLTFELLDIAQQEHVRVLHLQVKFDSLEQNSLQHHHLFLLKEVQIPQTSMLVRTLQTQAGQLRTCYTKMLHWHTWSMKTEPLHHIYNTY